MFPDFYFETNETLKHIPVASLDASPAAQWSWEGYKYPVLIEASVQICLLSLSNVLRSEHGATVPSLQRQIHSDMQFLSHDDNDDDKTPC